MNALANRLDELQQRFQREYRPGSARTAVSGGRAAAEGRAAMDVCGAAAERARFAAAVAMVEYRTGSKFASQISGEGVVDVEEQVLNELLGADVD
jgi:hypothetical protein